MIIGVNGESDSNHGCRAAYKEKLTETTLNYHQGSIDEKPELYDLMTLSRANVFQLIYFDQKRANSC